MVYRLPVKILNSYGLTTVEEELVTAMEEHTPDTKFRPGDLAYLLHAPDYVRIKFETVPRFWKVRFVVSQWAHELHQMAHADPERVMGVDHAVALLEAQGSLTERNYNRPWIYAHGYPHGRYPDTASWFPERALRRVMLRENNQEWETILDEAKAPFLGYEDMAAGFAFDLAPDLYAKGENLGRPFYHEEDTFHTACLLGMEEPMMKPVDPYIVGSEFDKGPLDPDHDFLASRAKTGVKR